MRAPAPSLCASDPTAPGHLALAVSSQSTGQSADIHFLKMPYSFIHSFIVHSGRPYSEQALSGITPLIPKGPPELAQLLPQLGPNSVPPVMRTQHTLAQATELKVGVLEGLLHLLVQRLLLALQQDGGTAVQDALGSALHHQQVPVVIGVLSLMDGELWTERRTVVPEPRRGLEAAHTGSGRHTQSRGCQDRQLP